MPLVAAEIEFVADKPWFRHKMGKVRQSNQKNHISWSSLDFSSQTIELPGEKFGTLRQLTLAYGKMRLVTKRDLEALQHAPFTAP